MPKVKLSMDELDLLEMLIESKAEEFTEDEEELEALYSAQGKFLEAYYAQLEVQAEKKAEVH